MRVVRWPRYHVGIPQLIIGIRHVNKHECKRWAIRSFTCMLCHIHMNSTYTRQISLDTRWKTNWNTNAMNDMPLTTGGNHSLGTRLGNMAGGQGWGQLNSEAGHTPLATAGKHSSGTHSRQESNSFKQSLFWGISWKLRWQRDIKNTFHFIPPACFVALTEL